MYQFYNSTLKILCYTIFPANTYFVIRADLSILDTLESRLKSYLSPIRGRDRGQREWIKTENETYGETSVVKRRGNPPFLPRYPLDTQAIQAVAVFRDNCERNAIIA